MKTFGPDVALIVAEGEAVGAAVFTQNRFCAAPVLVSREHVRAGRLSAIVANSGCANACTGEQGLSDAREMASIAATALGIHPHQVLVASTGIIGHHLPMALLREAIPRAALEAGADGFQQVAEAIITTDTRPKTSGVSLEVDGRTVCIAGMAKGAGMVMPRMATVFGFFMTDAAVEPEFLDSAFRAAIKRSFNRVTVDGDTSTNDTACILSSGAAANAALSSEHPDAARFVNALSAVAEDLAKQLARDGEGATHLVTVTVKGAQADDDAEMIAFSIANSPLVKTAIYGRDPNWGRIAMAAGKTGIPFDPARTAIRINGVTLAEEGAAAPFDTESLRESMKAPEIEIEFLLDEGDAEARCWTCDYSYDYVRINAEYHT